MKNKINQQMLLLAVAGSVSAGAWALDPAYIPVVDGVVFTPTLEVIESYDSNLYGERDNRKSSWVTTLAPTFRLNADGHKSSYQLRYTAERDMFHSSSRDNNTDHYLSVDAGYRINERNRLVLDASYQRVTDIGASSLLEGRRISDFDKYNIKSVGGNYTYGADTARMQVDLGLNYDELRFRGESREEEVNRNRERDTTSLSSTFYYRVAPRTSLLLEGQYTDYDYVRFSKRDSTNLALMAGARWESTATTAGHFKVGRERKKFKNSYSSGKGFKDKTGNRWEAGVTWSPLSYSTVRFNTRRGIIEADGDASNIRLQVYELDWQHYWRERLYSNVELGHRKFIFQRNEYGTRHQEKLKTQGVKMTYEMRRWLDISMGYTHYQQDSNSREIRYGRDVYTLAFQVSL